MFHVSGFLFGIIFGFLTKPISSSFFAHNLDDKGVENRGTPIP